tara:strand:- start:295 stop:531 length:237 start_codon:yes stop_codon:yes gene_type:complete
MPRKHRIQNNDPRRRRIHAMEFVPCPVQRFPIHGLFVVKGKQRLAFSIHFTIPLVDPSVSTGNKSGLASMKMKKDERK